MQTRPLSLIAIGALALASCGGESDSGDVVAIVTPPDPLVSRALNDPLMIDPDLVLRSEAHAALTIAYDHALPPHSVTSDDAEAAREAATRELLETGPLADLPLASARVGGEPLALGMSADDMITATGAPGRCLGQLEEGLIWAARMPAPASLMPHGMAMQAAGADSDNCKMRIVRYLTPVAVDDALRYHYNRALRGQMEGRRSAQPEDIIESERGSEHLRVHARPGPGGTSAVDVIYWTR